MPKLALVQGMRCRILRRLSIVMRQMVMHVCSVAQGVAGTVEMFHQVGKKRLDIMLGLRTIQRP